MNPDLKLAFVKAESYGCGDTSSGQVRFSDLDRMDFRGKRVLVIDDILDTGHTLCALSKTIRNCGALEVKSCVLLDKPSRREVSFEAILKFVMTILSLSLWRISQRYGLSCHLYVAGKIT
jgi:hypoxanthine phosphoribosyltransferase